MPAGQSSQLRVVEGLDIAKQRRIIRAPSHDFNLKTQAFAITPFFIAPALPGETFARALLQARVVTDPINHPLIGWWKEYYVFFVPWRGMPDLSATLKSMALDPATVMTAAQAGANSTAMYTFKSGLNVVDECLEVVVEEFFRDEGESYTAATIGGYPKAIVDQGKWWHSLKKESTTGDDSELPGVDELEELDILPGFTTHYAQWEAMRDLNMTDLTFEDYLRAEGVSVPKANEKTGTPQLDFKPELYRYIRQWTYPTNHIDPATGTPSSACSWSFAEKITKRRKVSEPGYFFGVTVCRPKIYFGNQKGAAVGALQSIYNYAPKLLAGDTYTRLVETLDTATDGILQNQTEDYWFDPADLLVFGDQFINYAATVATGHAFALPTAALEKRYAADADITALFKTAGTEYIREDGRITLNVLTHVRQDT